MTIDPTKRLNKLTGHAQNVLQRNDFADWKAKDRISSTFDKLNEKMLSAYNRCGGGQTGSDDDDDEDYEEIIYCAREDELLKGRSCGSLYSLYSKDHSF